MNYFIVSALWLVVVIFLVGFIIMFDRKKFASVSNGFLYIALSFVLGVAFLLACLRHLGI